MRCAACIGAGQLRLPDALSAERFVSLLNRLGRKVKWNVRVCSRYAHGRGVSLYLARYVKGGPFATPRSCAPATREVLFRYTPHSEAGEPKRSATLALVARSASSPACSSTPPSRAATPCATTGCTRMPAPSSSTPPARCTRKPRSSRPQPIDWQSYLARFPRALAATRCPQCQRPAGARGAAAPPAAHPP